MIFFVLIAENYIRRIQKKDNTYLKQKKEKKKKKEINKTKSGHVFPLLISTLPRQ